MFFLFSLTFCHFKVHPVYGNRCRMSNSRPVQVVLGDHDIRRQEGTEVTRRPHRVVVHAGFPSEAPVHDIALIKLDRPVNFTNYVRPVCLPERSTVFDGQTCVVTGWGVTRQGNADL